MNTERIYGRFTRRYVEIMMLATRAYGSLGGLLVLYYVNLTTRMPAQIQQAFDRLGLFFVTTAVAGTVVLGLWNTRTLRRVLAKIADGKVVNPEEGRIAVRQAYRFPYLQNVTEAIVVSVLSYIPLCCHLHFYYGASLNILIQITISAWLGIASVLLVTFLLSERWIDPVLRDLSARGFVPDWNGMPKRHLHSRMVVCFSLVLIVATELISALANQRAMDIVRNPERQWEAVRSLQVHTTLIMMLTAIVGLLFCRMISRSVTGRMETMVNLMRRVEGGDLKWRLEPVGNDEVDLLARQFDTMVDRLDQAQNDYRELNSSLEQKVYRRTRQLSRSKRQLEASFKKLQDHDRLKTEFFSNVSHELRTPLTMILSPVEQIRKISDGHLPERAQSLLNIVELNASRLLKQINQLLEFSKLEAGREILRISQVNLPQMIRDLSTAAEPLAEERGLALVLKLDPSAPLILADEEKLDTIISNLLSNALKFTPSGGKITISVEPCQSGIRVAVADTGIGISPENYGKVFDRFVQIDGSTTRQYSGTGLGLAMVRELVELMGGRIHVESQLGQGTRFWFELPLNKDNTPAAPLEPALESPTTVSRQKLSNRIRFADLESSNLASQQISSSQSALPDTQPKLGTILIVDDTPEIRLMVGEMLQDQYHVRFATDGLEGLAAALREIPDLILSDVMMPRMDGYEFCEKIREHSELSHVPLVLMTARTDLSMKIEGLNCGADDYLVKPFHAEELRARVRSLMRVRSLNLSIRQRNTELQSAITELHQTQSQLVHAEKMTSLGQLAAGLAHEINNSINAVANGVAPLLGKVERMRELVITHHTETPAHKTAGEDELANTCDKIGQLAAVVQRGVERTTQIVSDLKLFSHPRTDEVVEFDPNATLDLCLQLLSNQTKQRITVIRDYAELGVAVGPSGQLQQIFLNLLNNAQQAIPRTGEITVTTRKFGTNFVEVRIRDTGPGIPENIRSRIFDPFFTTKPPGVGTGLGLSLSYSLLKKMGGSINFTTELGIGTEFIVRFPFGKKTTPKQVQHEDRLALPQCVKS